MKTEGRAATMLALFFDGKKLELRALPKPAPFPDEALVRVTVAGVCRTDLEIVKGYMGFVGVPGHEFVGVVEQALDPGLVGRRVVGEINFACGSCDFCHRGLERHCPNRTVLGILGHPGVFAEYVRLPVKNLHAVPATVSDRSAVCVEPVAACFEILEQVDVRGKSVLVLGDGKLGILAARVLASHAGPGRGGPSSVTLAGKHPEKLALAASAEIETRLVDDALAIAQTPERKFDLVVEATGRPDGFGHALAMVRPRGVIVQKTTVAERVTVDLAKIVIDEITVIGSRCGPFPPALEAIASGAVKVEDLIQASYPLSQAPRAFAAAAAPGALKVLIVVQASSLHSAQAKTQAGSLHHN